MDSLIRKFQQRIEDPEHARASSRYSIELKDPMGSVPEFGGFLSPEVRRTLHEYFGTPFRVVETQAFRTFPIPESDRERKHTPTSGIATAIPLPG